MQCPSCHFDNADGMNFCGKCGYKLSSFLKIATQDLSYNEKLIKIQKYLPKDLTHKILSKRDKIEGERKQVTVLFCDMVSFTQLSETIGPEEAYSIMDQVYEILIQSVHDHEGTVNEFTGDGIMALFGAPIALEDGPQRAIRSAHAIHREIAQFSDKIIQEKKDFPSLKMRIGIHTGPVVVGTLGNDLRVEFKAVGDTVNLASRMEGLAEPGTTYVTRDTFKLAEKLFQFESMGKKEIKGKKKAVFVYKILSEKEEVYRARIGFERMIYSEMVGREKELNKLQLQVMNVIKGDGSVVNIIGEAGIGKSRLMAELKGCDVIKKVALLEGRAIPIGRNLSFHLIINLLREWAQIKEDDSGAAALIKLETAVGRVDPEGMQEVVPFVATLMGMKLSGRYAERVKGIEGESLEKLILKNIREFLIKATGLNPLVLVAEDLHWADTSSLELMESLLPLVKNQKILFVNVFRPGYSETGDRIIKSIKEMLPEYYTEIELEPLDERMSEALINNMLNIKGVQYTVINKVIERAGGNPFFIEEVMRAFIDEGAVIVKDGAFEVTENIENMAIPYTINDVLMARIDRLEEEIRNLLKIASVIGRSFFYRILAECAQAIEEIDNKLSYLKEIQLIIERKRLEEIEYLFKHALAQEAAYESILEQNRKRLHLKVANSIEKIFNNRLYEFYGVLAYHYSKGNNHDKAEEYMIKAGEEALKSSASTEALQYWQEALNLYLKKHGQLASSEKVAMLEKNIGLAFFNKGHFKQAVKYFDDTLSHYGESIPVSFFSQILKFFICFFNYLNFLYLPFSKSKKIPSKIEKEIIRVFYKKCEALAFYDTKRFFIESIYFMSKLIKFDLKAIKNGTSIFSESGVLFAYSGISFKIAKKAMASIKEDINFKEVGDAITYYTSEYWVNLLIGDWDVLKSYDDSIVNEAINKGISWQSIANYLTALSVVERERGNFSVVRKVIEKLIDIGEQYSSDQNKEYGFSHKLQFLVKIRGIHDAQFAADELLLFCKKRELKFFLCWYYSFKAYIQILLSDIAEAEKCLLYAEENLSKMERVPLYLGTFLLSKFTLRLLELEGSIKKGDHSEIRKNQRIALKSGKLAVKNSKKTAIERTEIYRHMGTYFWLVKKQKRALKWWDKSINEGKYLGARVELSRTYMEVGRRLLEPKSKYKKHNGIKAYEYLSKAKSMFEEMELQWDLDELAKLN